MAVADSPGATTFDVAEALCPNGCEVYVDGTWIFRDRTHVGNDASARLIPAFAEIVAPYAER